MVVSNEERERLSNEFGKIVAERFDSALSQLRKSLSGTHSSDQRLREYLDSLPEVDRPIAIAQRAMETFLHGLMFAIESSDIYHLTATSSDGSAVDLKESADAGLHTEQFYWLEDFSQNESIIDKEV